MYVFDEVSKMFQLSGPVHYFLVDEIKMLLI